MSEVTQLTAVGMGEILWDLLPGGRRLGGAPTNFAYHCRSLGARGEIVSAVGEDEDGREILSALDRLGLGRAGVAGDPEHPTGLVDVTVSEAGQPKYIIRENAAWDFSPLTSATKKLAAAADIVCFGSLGQRSPGARRTIGTLLDLVRPDCLRVFDVNLRQHYHSPELIDASLRRADVFKLNDEELPLISEQAGCAGGSPREVLARLRAKYDLKLIALTNGKRGSLLLTASEADEHPGHPAARVADTVGAGDSFTAALAVGFALGRPLKQINDAANRLASFVCTQAGGTPELPAELAGLWR